MIRRERLTKPPGRTSIPSANKPRPPSRPWRWPGRTRSRSSGARPLSKPAAIAWRPPARRRRRRRCSWITRRSARRSTALSISGPRSQGEVVNPGQGIVTLINPDDLWVRADVEESYIDRIRLGDRLTVRLPSGARREGTVFYRGRRRRLRHAARRQPHQARHQDVRNPAALRQPRPRAGRGHDGVSSPCRCEAEARLNPAPMLDVEVENLTKRFGDFCAVDALSFSVNHGEVFGLLGPNGAGKSTLIRMLTTLVPPTSGTARVNGFDIVRSANDVRKSIGVIPQAMTSDLDLSAEENMAIFAKLYGIRGEKRRRTIRELLAAVDLTQWADKPVKMFSGGMRRRLEIARGLVHEPKIFFLDEPTTGLDPVSRVAVWEMLSRLKRERDLTILVTTHYMDEADKLCDRIAIVDHGKLAALDSPLKLKASIPGQEHHRGQLFGRARRAGGRHCKALPEVADVKADEHMFPHFLEQRPAHDRGVHGGRAARPGSRSPRCPCRARRWTTCSCITQGTSCATRCKRPPVYSTDSSCTRVEARNEHASNLGHH